MEHETTHCVENWAYMFWYRLFLINRQKANQMKFVIIFPFGSIHMFFVISWIIFTYPQYGLPWWLRWQRICLQHRRPGFSPWVGKIPWRGEWQTTPVLLLGEFHGQRSLTGPWLSIKSMTICKGLQIETTEQLTHTHYTVVFKSLSLSTKFHIWNIYLLFIIVVQLLSHVQLFVTPWTAALQTSLSFTISQSLL